MPSNAIAAAESRIFSFLAKAKRPLVVILGPTASGKTNASLELAESITGRFGKSVEIVNGDSRQLYKFLDIGTAKIRSSEMRDIPHHLPDVLDPKDEITAGEYQTMAFRSIDEILDRGAIPMLVGGSMLYLSAVIDNLSFAGTSDPAVRSSLEKEYDKDGGETLYERLSAIDPDTAASFHPHNKPYLLRAMEILTATGKKPSEVKASAAAKYDLFIIGITRSRDALVERINERTRQMFRDGWVDEVRSLIPGYTGNNSHLFQGAISLIVEKMHDLVLHRGQSFILDSTFSNYMKATDNIKRSLEKGRVIFIFYIYQKPEIAWKFTKAREEAEGRSIPESAFIEQFLSARETVNQIAGEFRDKIVIFLVKKDFEKNTEDIVKIGSKARVDDYITERYTKDELEKCL